MNAIEAVALSIIGLSIFPTFCLGILIGEMVAATGKPKP